MWSRLGIKTGIIINRSNSSSISCNNVRNTTEVVTVATTLVKALALAARKVIIRYSFRVEDRTIPHTEATDVDLLCYIQTSTWTTNDPQTLTGVLYQGKKKIVCRKSTTRDPSFTPSGKSYIFIKSIAHCQLWIFQPQTQ